MTIATRSALAFLTLGLLAACGGGSSSPPPVTASFDGTWAVCRNDGGADYRELFTIAGTGVSLDMIDYATTDATCDGDGSTGTPVPLTAVYGAQASAGLGAGNVLATQLDLSFPSIPPATLYTLIYRDTSASPDALHLGDDTGVLDSTTPALRPVSLQPLARTRQVAR